MSKPPSQPARFIIRTKPATVDYAAKRLGMSKKEVAQTLAIVKKVLGPGTATAKT